MKITQTRTLSRRPVTLNLLGLGCAQMGGLYRSTSYQDAAATFDAAWDAGIRYFDTAPYYGYSRSERRLGTMLGEKPRDAYVVSTKAGRVMTPDTNISAEENGWVNPLKFRPVFDYSHDGILRSFEHSQQRLGLATIDILYLHDIGSVTHGEQHLHYWSQLTEGGGFKALDRLRSEKSVSAVGLGVNEWQIIRDAVAAFDIDVAMLAGRYTLLEQESLAFLDDCAARGVGIVAAGVFNSGILAGNKKFNYEDASPELLDRVDQLQAVCDEAGVLLQAAALQFPLAHPAVVSVVTGVRNAGQLASNIGWFEQEIPATFWEELRSRGLLAEGAPFPGGL
ncbi:aldo/keto reductase [Rhizobium sp. KVB221]|uniref:Aldo/keto reductase n=1 Tax=Rhizobium setariae TaxID=2801340 RepID=A0A937CN29_9HYPH|nr:aldo/keto reductase [Rhizobium setariae]MBL0375005.1 aldo/keto reductase [Rhizobium setariae]